METKRKLNFDTTSREKKESSSVGNLCVNFQRVSNVLRNTSPIRGFMSHSGKAATFNERDREGSIDGFFPVRGGGIIPRISRNSLLENILPFVQM